MKNLIRNYTRQKLNNIVGPVTVVAGKNKRFTFIECNNDLNSMIDVAKVADLVLLMIDASFGFEMETFEFLNICQVHGFPRIMGVLTHMDLITNMKQLKKTKKRLKHRFWTEIYQVRSPSFLGSLAVHWLLANYQVRPGRQAVLPHRTGQQRVPQARGPQPGALHFGHEVQGLWLQVQPSLRDR